MAKNKFIVKTTRRKHYALKRYAFHGKGHSKYARKLFLNEIHLKPKFQ